MAPPSWCNRHSAPSCHYADSGQNWLNWLYPSCGAVGVPVNRTRLTQAEELVRSLYEREGACSAMATVAQTLQQLRNRRHSTLDQYNSTLVFIGDSITLRVYNAARCELAQVGFREIRAAPIVRPFITQHHSYSQLHAHMNATSRSTEHQAFGKFGTVYTRDLQLSAETHFALHDGTILTLVFLWRAGGERRGPGLCGDASTPHALLSVCLDLLRSFGPNTCVLYNEGIHHNNRTSTRSAFRSSVSHMCRLLYKLRLQTGALALVRETAAQNFPTPTAPPGYEGEFEFASSGHACISPPPASKNWHNEVLWDEATSWNLSIVPFYESTLFRGSVLFTQSKTLDCTHEICYTPAYYGPLWSALQKSVRVD